MKTLVKILAWLYLGWLLRSRKAPRVERAAGCDFGLDGKDALELLTSGTEGIQRWNIWNRSRNHEGYHANFNVDLNRACLRNRDLRNADLRGVNFSNADLRNSDLRGVDLRGVYLWEADLQGADLRNADLQDTQFGGADLRGADLSGADLRETRFVMWNGLPANVGGAMLCGITLSERTDFHPLWDYRAEADLGYLQLARAEGLDTAHFGDPSFLTEYTSCAFEYYHREDVMDAVFLSMDEGCLSRSQLSDSIAALHALYSGQAKPPEQLVEVARALSAEIISYLSKHPRELYNLRPRQFEELVAEVLASYGWGVELTPEIKDGGYDIYAIAPTGAPSVAAHWIIECKKFAAERRVGVELVRALYGVKADLRVGNAMLATTSQGFTRGTRAFKASKYDLELKSYSDILEWINSYQPNRNGRLYIKDNRVVVPNQGA